MADKSFPQIPATVWWGMRSLLQKTPSAKFEDSMIAASLGVQPVAARQYLAELKRVGILDEDGKATDLAGRWRLDQSYEDAVEELVKQSYPEALVTIAPPGEADRSVVQSWFMSQGLGEGSARNKAATYLLLSSNEPGEVVTSSSAAKKTADKPKKASKVQQAPNERVKREKNANNDDGRRKARPQDGIPLNVNVQIHISADASPEQIESIFSSMRKNLYDE